MTILNNLPSGETMWVQMPHPETMAEQAMAIHHILNMLVDDRLNRAREAGVFKPCEFKGETMTVLRDCAERCAQLGRDIDRLARAG